MRGHVGAQDRLRCTRWDKEDGPQGYEGWPITKMAFAQCLSDGSTPKESMCHISSIEAVPARRKQAFRGGSCTSVRSHLLLYEPFTHRERVAVSQSGFLE